MVVLWLYLMAALLSATAYSSIRSWNVDVTVGHGEPLAVPSRQRNAHVSIRITPASSIGHIADKQNSFGIVSICPV